jgi:hypothetical protein
MLFLAGRRLGSVSNGQLLRSVFLRAVVMALFLRAVVKAVFCRRLRSGRCMAQILLSSICKACTGDSRRQETGDRAMKRAKLGLLEVLGLLVQCWGKVTSRLSPCFAGELRILLSSLFGAKNPLGFAIFSWSDVKPLFLTSKH